MTQHKPSHTLVCYFRRLFFKVRKGTQRFWRVAESVEAGECMEKGNFVMFEWLVRKKMKMNFLTFVEIRNQSSGNWKMLKMAVNFLSVRNIWFLELSVVFEKKFFNGFLQFKFLIDEFYFNKKKFYFFYIKKYLEKKY
jgi:hypothetical protein